MNQYIDLLAQFGIGGAHPGGFALTHAIFAKENIPSHNHVLDIGCGTGQTASFLATNYGCNVSTIDVHPLMVEKAEKRFANEGLDISVVLGDVQNMIFENDSFDFVLSESVISFTDIQKTLNEIARVLKEDGCMLMIEMTAEQTIPNDIKEQITKLYGIAEILTANEWIAHLQKAGFTNIKEIRTPPLLLPSDLDDIDQSDHISMALYDVWEAHDQFIEQNSHLVGYRAFKCFLQ